MKNANLNAETICLMGIGLYMIFQFGYFGCRHLEADGSIAAIKASSGFDKAVLGFHWLLVLIGFNVIVAAPPADSSILTMALSTISMIVLLTSLVAMYFHLEEHPEVNSYKELLSLKVIYYDMVAFCAGIGILWVSSSF